MASGRAPDIGHVALLCGTTADGTNAILEYTTLLNAALREQGAASTMVNVEARVPDLRSYDTVVLQYNPFLYGRWGFAPHVVASLGRARLGADRLRLALMVHETYFPISDWRSAIIGSTQWGQLRALHAISDVVFTSIEPWVRLLASWSPRRPVWHLPVGSNLPDCRKERAESRDEIEADDATIVLASFGTGHPSRLIDHMVAAANAVARHHEHVLMLNLGAGARSLDGLDRDIRVVQPGLLPAADVARLLSAGDLFLAPFVDGVSTRRTSVMAAMQHGLPIVGTIGELTGESLQMSGALELVAPGDPRAFSHAAAALAQDPARRAALGAAAAALYRRKFDWPMIADRMRRRLGYQLSHLPSKAVRG